MTKYEYQFIPTHVFDEGGLGYIDTSKLKLFVAEMQKKGWEMVSIGDGLVTFRKEVS